MSGKAKANSTHGLVLRKRSDAGGIVVMECSGNLIAETAPQLKEMVKSLIPHEKRITLDLTGLTRMDSSGLGALVGLYVSARRAKCELKLANLSRPVRELLGLTNLLSVFEDVGKLGARMG
jgi:anti-anti-sigma factor